MESKKTFIINCVNDALKMEKSIYTLNEIASECHSRANNIQVNAEQKKRIAESNHSNSVFFIERLQNRINDEKKHAIRNIYNEDGLSWFAKWYGISILIGFFLICGIFKLLTLFFNEEKMLTDILKLPEYVPPLIWFLFSTLILAIIFHIVKNKRIRNEKDTLKQAKEDHKTTEHNLQIANNNYSIAKRECEFLREQANVCQTKSHEIQNVLNKFYTHTNVIPVDFRRIDCVLIFSFVFRNDLADTMREAVFYYEEKCFRNGVIQGLKNIADKIDELARAMAGIGHEIHSIHENIDTLCNENKKITEKISISNELQKESIQETRATRYAVESLQHSFDTYKYYQLS